MSLSTAKTSATVTVSKRASRPVTKSALFPRWPEARAIEERRIPDPDGRDISTSRRHACGDHRPRNAGCSPRMLRHHAGRGGVPMRLYQTHNVAAGNRLYEID